MTNSEFASSNHYDCHAKGMDTLDSMNTPNADYWDFSKNLFKSLSDFPSNSLLINFDISHNLIELIEPDILIQYPKLENLNFSSNLITKIQNLDNPSLKLLDLSNNKISIIENLENLQMLLSLNLESNRIHSVFLLRPLSKLSTLDLSYNPIDIFNYNSLFPNLANLAINNCNFHSLKSICGFKSLTKLSIANNKICEDCILDLPHLEYLNISHNKITSLQAFINLKNLKELDISYNCISDASFSIQNSLPNLISLNLSGTLISDPANVLNVFPNIQKCLFSNTLVSDLQIIINFLKQNSQLTSLDLRNLPFTQNLYFDNDTYQSIDEYDRKYPDNQEERRKYRLTILNVLKVNYLDGILTNNEDKLENDIRNDDIEILEKLLNEQNELRNILGLSSISILINDMDPEERKEYTQKVLAENQSLKKQIQEMKDKNKESNSISIVNQKYQDELNQLIQKNNELHKQLNHNYVSEFQEKDIKKLIKLYNDANTKLQNEIDQQKTTVVFKKKRRSREYVIEICQKSIFQIAKTKINNNKPSTVLSESSEEFLLVEGWISAKIFTKIKLKSVIKNIVFDKMREMEKTMKWMTLAVDTGMNSMEIFQEGIKKPIIIADHLNHIESKLKKQKEAIFLICAFDNGKVIVNLDHSSKLPDVSSYLGKCDSLLFHWKHHQFFYALSQDRVLPLYIAHVILDDNESH